MSNKDTIVIVSSSSFDSGSNISKDPTKTWACAPDKEIESQSLDLPDDWRPPSRPFARFCFTQLCLVIIGKPDLEELWQDVNHEAGWDKVMGNDLWKALDHKQCWCRYFINIDLKMVHRIPIFRPSFVFLACSLILRYADVSTADHSYKENYGDMWEFSALLFLSEIQCRMFFAATVSEMEMKEIWAHKPPKVAILFCLALSRMADFCVALSWACLVSCGLGLLLDVNAVNCWMFLAGPCMFAPFLYAAFKKKVQAVIQRGGLAFIL